MVSARLVDAPDSSEDITTKPIPELMFAAGEEPVGVRVLTYQSSGAIRRIINCLEAEEVELIRRSAFGKILDIAEKPVFSGRFARYLLSRQLKTKKKYEIWFKFAGKPIRFSLREFAIVTGLPCGEFPMRSKSKLKKTICQKSYWPTLFGRSDVVTVSSVLKMLWRKTVKDREIRIKFACLAILESVLLPTSLNMKICREHAEAIEDLDEFFSYPWGRVAFDMLIGSIKERDEVGLSQNTIAVKGFALALQLVLVEAVPSLTEVGQESCSSSECDSEDDVNDPLWGKKQTLNPAHARNEDKKIDVIVRSILSQDPERPIDESSVIRADEEEDSTVDNMVALINANYNFKNSMYVGGMTKIEVSRLRERSKLSMKSRKSRQRSANAAEFDYGFIASLVLQDIKPHLSCLETNINHASKRIDSIESSVIGVVDDLFTKLKDDLQATITSMVNSALGKGQPSGLHFPQGNTRPIPNCVSGNVSIADPVLAENDKSIRDVLENISHYSSPSNSQAENHLPSMSGSPQKGSMKLCPRNDGAAQSAQSQNHSHQANITQTPEVENRLPAYLTDMPSFSLGLTQDENIQVDALGLATNPVTVPLLTDIHVGDNMDDPPSSRKSKRQKTVPSALLHDYQCGPHIISRMRRSQKVVFVSYDVSEMQRKFELMTQLPTDICVNVAGLFTSSKEMQMIAERSRVFPAKVVDLLLRLVRFVVLQQPLNEALQNYYFLDTRFSTAFVRHYRKFSKSKKKDSYHFPKALVEFLHNEDGSPMQRRRFYFPLCVAKKHWVGICFDTVYGKLTILDCNITYSTEEAMEQRVSPFLHMLPYFMRQQSGEIVDDEVMPYTFERPKSVSQYEDPPDSGLMAVLLMVIHAVYGVEACKHITSDSLISEGKSAAIMAYEFKETL